MGLLTSILVVPHAFFKDKIVGDSHVRLNVSFQAGSTEVVLRVAEAEAALFTSTTITDFRFGIGIGRTIWYPLLFLHHTLALC